MGKFVANQPLEMEAWTVSDILANHWGWTENPEILQSAVAEGILELRPQERLVLIKLADAVFEADTRYTIIYCEGQFSVQLNDVFDENHTPAEEVARKQTPESWTGDSWLGSEEINHRFGVHTARIENGGDSIDHVTLRKEFIKFAGNLDRQFVRSREKSLAMTQLEDASMWFHKALGRQGELVKD